MEIYAIKYMLNVYYIIYVQFFAGARPCDTATRTIKNLVVRLTKGLGRSNRNLHLIYLVTRKSLL